MARRFDKNISARVEEDTAERVKELAQEYSMPEAKLYRIFIKAAAIRVAEGGPDEFIETVQDSQRFNDEFAIAPPA